MFSKVFKKVQVLFVMLDYYLYHRFQLSPGMLKVVCKTVNWEEPCDLQSGENCLKNMSSHLSFPCENHHISE